MASRCFYKTIQCISRCWFGPFFLKQNLKNCESRLPCFFLVKNRQFAMESRVTPYGSKHHPLSVNEATELSMLEKFKEIQVFSFDDWEEFRMNYLLHNFEMTESNFDSITMHALVSHNSIELAQSFMDYLKEIGVKPNLITCVKFMLLCSNNRESCSQDLILKTYNRIKNTLDSSLVLDAVTVNCVVRSLCATDQWRKSFDYLNKLPVNNPHQDSKNALVHAAFKNDDESLGWSMVLNYYPLGSHPGCDVLKEYVQLASRTYAVNPELGDALFTKCMHYIQSNNIIAGISLAEAIADYFRNHRSKWNLNWTKVNKESTCDACNTMLENTNLSDREFELLKESFFEKSVRKSDIYINTNKEELGHFIIFLNNRGPFDYVVDGLNIAYSREKDSFNTKKDMALQLLEVIKKLSKKSNRILVLGRWHMKKWPNNILYLITQKAKIFYTSNHSQDDPFIIHAALFSGPKSLVVSSDLMRDHMSRLDTLPLIKLFRRWQQSHQLYVSFDKNAPIFQGPLKHSICVQGSMTKGWHIPYDNSFILEPYDVLNNWLCIHRTEKQ